MKNFVFRGTYQINAFIWPTEAALDLGRIRGWMVFAGCRAAGLLGVVVEWSWGARRRLNIVVVLKPRAYGYGGRD